MKKVIIIASGILFFILILLLLLSRQKKQTQNNQALLPTPTLIEVNIDNQKRQMSESDQQTISQALPLTSYENTDFKFDYNYQTNQFVVFEKTPEAREKFYQWINQNNLQDLAGNPELLTFQDSQSYYQNLEPTPISKFFIDTINDFFVMLQKTGENIPANSTNNQPSFQPLNLNPQNPPSTSNPPSNFIYYAQCDSEYADLPLPDGCNMCQAGCGAATVSMIASSYLGKQYDPKNIVNQYKSKGYLLSCAGSRYSDAHSLLQSLGLKTTDYITFNYETADQAVGDLRKYLNAGWTFFTLANFKENGGGHYFWITDIDEKGNIWAYDPYYGRFEAPPINENSRYPFPKYRLAFGVKR